MKLIQRIMLILVLLLTFSITGAYADLLGGLKSSITTKYDSLSNSATTTYNSLNNYKIAKISSLNSQIGGLKISITSSYNTLGGYKDSAIGGLTSSITSSYNTLGGYKASAIGGLKSSITSSYNTLGGYKASAISGLNSQIGGLSSGLKSIASPQKAKLGGDNLALSSAKIGLTTVPKTKSINGISNKYKTKVNNFMGLLKNNYNLK